MQGLGSTPGGETKILPAVGAAKKKGVVVCTFLGSTKNNPLGPGLKVSAIH